MKKVFMTLTAVALLASTAVMAKGQGGTANGGAATMQRSAGMTANQYRYQTQVQSTNRAMLLQDQTRSGTQLKDQTQTPDQTRLQDKTQDRIHVPADSAQ